MYTLSRSASASAVSDNPAESPRLLIECAQFVRHSRSLASMMPALCFSGAASLLVSVLLHGLAIDAVGVELHGWLESWLTLWPLLFPLVYVASLLARKIRGLAVARMDWQQGLGYGDIAAVTEQLHAGRSVLRGLRPRHDYLA
ncbi:hypothetical protein [Noviherbaspirillum aerium]|uniref:hypothetical protein n=1 Tax=Noviherbaspirillum aerium TaxID=2588497 RepID=UPI00124C354D|nr:hypothetical protein [Noviherbaspirillum aerium]